MRYSTYAAIVIGSKNILMKIYELSMEKGASELDSMCYEYELGKEAYTTHRVPMDFVETICDVLKEFKVRMSEYGVCDYHCYATSAIRQADNQLFVLNHIKIRTGITVEMISNSELRFLMYKGIYYKGLDLNTIVEKNSALLDIGSGSIQISLFDKKNLCMTQNLNIGTATIRETLDAVEHNVLDYFSVMEEYIAYELDVFKKSYLKDKEIKNVIAIGDEIKMLNVIAPELSLKDTINEEQIMYIYKKVKQASYEDIALQYGIPVDHAKMILPSILIYKKFLEEAKADTIYIFGTNLCDGSVIDYGQKNNKISVDHDFRQDIISAARFIGKRYRYNKIRALNISEFALAVFDRTAKFHGLNARDRLLLEISAILLDIGKYVNINDPGTIGYQLIMSTEILGISHIEREVVANVVRYNTNSLPEYEDLTSAFWRKRYLKIAKLSAILRLANAMDRGHTEWFRNWKVMRKGKELIILVESDQDLSLEISLFHKKATYFTEIMGIHPVLKQKNIL